MKNRLPVLRTSAGIPVLSGCEPTEIEQGAADITVFVEQPHVGRIAIEEQGVEITGIAAQEGRRYVPRIGNQQAAPTIGVNRDPAVAGRTRQSAIAITMNMTNSARLVVLRVS